VSNHTGAHSKHDLDKTTNPNPPPNRFVRGIHELTFSWTIVGFQIPWWAITLQIQRNQCATTTTGLLEEASSSCCTERVADWGRRRLQVAAAQTEIGASSRSDMRLRIGGGWHPPTASSMHRVRTRCSVAPSRTQPPGTGVPTERSIHLWPDLEQHQRLLPRLLVSCWAASVTLVGPLVLEVASCRRSWATGAVVR
jgi:hypothetical protein